ncbi:hypothetical protein [Nonomuraea sp. NPDC050643]|uniref:hypothetical protein n=1 Tax=Nonomuraea sp. NPDC050643 TaxID=3155660 RepID=UPI00340D100A
MDLEAEILDLKRRMEELEASRCSPEGDGGLASIGVIEMKSLITDAQGALTEDLSALNAEIGGLRWDINKVLKSGNMQTLDQLDALRIDVIHLGLKLDQLLEKGR